MWLLFLYKRVACAVTKPYRTSTVFKYSWIRCYWIQMYSPSKEERIRNIEIGRYFHKKKKRNRKKVDKQGWLLPPWLPWQPQFTYHTIGGRNWVSEIAWSAVLEDELLRLSGRQSQGRVRPFQVCTVHYQTSSFHIAIKSSRFTSFRLCVCPNWL